MLKLFDLLTIPFFLNWNGNRYMYSLGINIVNTESYLQVIYDLIEVLLTKLS